MSENQDNSNREPVENLVVLLRGFFATPVLSSLGRLGVLQKMREMEYFDGESFPVIKNKKLLQDSLNYCNWEWNNTFALFSTCSIFS